MIKLIKTIFDKIFDFCWFIGGLAFKFYLIYIIIKIVTN